MSNPAPRRCAARSALLPLVLAALCGCKPDTGVCDGTSVSILPLSDVTVRESEVIDFDVEGTGTGVLSVETMPLPGWLFTPLSNSPPRAKFRWVPTAAQVGTHQITFQLTGANGCDTETVTLNVLPGASGQPRFVGNYRVTLDVTQPSPYVEIPISVQDDDSSTIALSVLAGTEIPGAVLSVEISGKTGVLTWVPTQEQIDSSCTYATRLVADDGVNQAEQEVFIQLRPPARPPEPGCGAACPEGDPPTIVHEALRNQDNRGPFPVQAEIIEKETVLQSAAVFWTNLPPAKITRLEDFQAVPMGLVGKDVYAAEIPAQPADTVVTYFICAADDDDPNGEGCDRFTCTLDTNGGAPFSFIARQGVVAKRSRFCEPCATHDDCEAPGYCFQGTCGLECTDDPGVCPGGATCELTGGSVRECAPRGGTCQCQLTGQNCIKGGRPIFNEVYPAPDVDVNFDGVASTTQDEYIEIVNTSSSASVDVSGWVIEDAVTIARPEEVRFRFPAGTVLPPRGVALIFGGGDSCSYCGRDEVTNDCLPCPDGLQVFAAPNPGLGLNNTGDTLVLLDAAGAEIDRMSYTEKQAATNISVNRLVDADPNAPFVVHTEAQGASYELSPGFTVTGESF